MNASNNGYQQDTINQFDSAFSKYLSNKSPKNLELLDAAIENLRNYSNKVVVEKKPTAGADDLFAFQEELLKPVIEKYSLSFEEIQKLNEIGDDWITGDIENPKPWGFLLRMAADIIKKNEFDKLVDKLQEEVTKLETSGNKNAATELKKIKEDITTANENLYSKKKSMEESKNDLHQAINKGIKSKILNQNTKKIFVNMLCLLSVVGAVALAATAQNRGSFWYRPEKSAAETILKDYSKNQMEPKPSSVKRGRGHG